MSNFSKQSFDYISDVLASPPTLTSLQSSWQEITLEENDVPQGQLPEICLSQHMIGVNIGQHLNCEMKADGRFMKYPILTGDFILIPAELAFIGNSDRTHRSIALNLSHALLISNASELWGIDKVELVPSHPARDPLITNIAVALRKELATNADGCQLYAKTMANALAVHLLHNFSNCSYKVTHCTGALSPKKLKKVLDYINDNLGQKIEIEELADLAQLSQYHFSRAFKQSTGLSPHQYVIRQRVEKAKQLLSQRTMSISEIALTCGFTHQSHLNRHFKRLLKITPKEFLNQLN